MKNDHWFYLINGINNKYGDVKCKICQLELKNYFNIPISEKLPDCLTDEEIIIKDIIE